MGIAIAHGRGHKQGQHPGHIQQPQLPVLHPVNEQDDQGKQHRQKAWPDRFQIPQLCNEANLIGISKAEGKHLGDHLFQNAIAGRPDADRGNSSQKAQQKHSGVGKEIPEALPGQQVAGDRQQNRPDDGGIGNADHGHDSEGNAVIQAVQGRVVLVLRAGDPGDPQIFEAQIQAGHQKGHGQLFRQVAACHGVAEHHRPGQQQQ